MIVVKVRKLFLDLHVTMKEVAAEMGKRLGKNYSGASLSKKLNRETITYKEMELIADILGYDLEFVERKK